MSVYPGFNLRTCSNFQPFARYGCIWNGCGCLDSLSCTPLLSEKNFTLFSKSSQGARFTTSYTRIGGVARDLPDGWLARVEKFVDQLPKAIDEVEKLLTRNRIFLDRTEDIGVITKDDAIAYGITGTKSACQWGGS